MIDNLPVVNVTGFEDVAGISGQHVKYEVAHKLNEAIELAFAAGFVITVELEPLQPLAMRNYRMIGNVRAAR